MAKKKDFRDELKKDFGNLVSKYRPVMEKTGQHLSKAVKSAEEDIARMYKVAQNQMEIQWNNLQKEKIYHRVGKELAPKILDGTIDIKGLDKFKSELAKIERQNKKVSRRLKKISGSKKTSSSGKKSSSSKKKTAKKASSKKK